MTHSDPDVKAPDCEEPAPRNLLEAFLHWIDCHPRTGWYLVVVASLNLILNVLDLFH